MLVISRRKSERIRLRGPDGTVTWITVLESRCGTKVRLGITAPPAVQVLREELLPTAEHYQGDTRAREAQPEAPTEAVDGDPPA